MNRRGVGLLIAIEGIDGAGKSTQADLLARSLVGRGEDVLRTREPTDGPHGRRLRESAQHGRMPPREELETFIADRREHVARTLAPALEAGKIVVIDRYYFSTAAYQGARGLDWQAILEANESFAPPPDLLVHLDLPVAAGLRRVAGRGDGADLFERERDLQKVAAIFRAIEGDALLRIDATLPAEAIHATIVQAVEGLLARRDATAQARPPAC